MKKVFLSLFLLICLNILISAQQQESYTFCTGGTYSYLLDTATTSTSTYFKRFSTGSTGYVAHFQKDTIFQSSGSGSGAGGYGSVKKWAWNGSTVTCVWTYTASNMHHDLCPLPNGNVLVIVSESKTAALVQAIGGNYTSNATFEKIQEIHPTSATTGTVVWEWKLWDHLCQNTTSTEPNYVSSIAANPQLWNINCNMTSSDFFHLNGIDYNPVRDQIVFTSHMQNEVFVIDHSTTTAQAASHLGGNAGKGGDFLYRWGSPDNYGLSATGNGITINVLHDVRWVPSTNSVWPNYISFFHNNTNQGNAQAVLFLPPYSTTNPYSFDITAGSVIGPATCTKPTVKGFTVQNQGGCQVLDNGNILITNPNTAFYECRNSATALQSISVSTVQSDRLKKNEVFGPWLTANANSATICANTSTTLNFNITTAPAITSPTYTYSWTSIPAGFTSTLQNPTITPTVAGSYTYTCVVSMTGTCSTTAITTTNTVSVVVTVTNCSLSADASATPTTVCAGTSSQLNVMPSGGTTYSYAWSSGGSSQSITVNPLVTTTYTVTVTSGTSTTTSLVTVNVNSLPIVTITSPDTVSICNGETTNINLAFTGISPWTFIGSDGSSQINVPVNTSPFNLSVNPIVNTTYSIVSVTDGNGCTSTSTGSVNVVVNTPIQVTISEAFGTLSSNATSGNQWYEQSSGVILSATSQNYTPTVNGNYYVIVTDQNGCSFTSPVYNFTYLSIQENDNTENVTVYPNPTNGLIFIKSLSLELTDFELIIFDICGKVQFQVRNVKECDLSNLQDGVYNLKINARNVTINKKIVLLK